MSAARARKFRKQLTPHEAKLWVALRQLRAQGLHFRRQAPLDGYYADFVCHGAKLIVEADGIQHGKGDQLAGDMKRDAHFAASGYRTLRFGNSEIDRDLGAVMEAICSAALSRRPPPDRRSAPATLPAGGRERHASARTQRPPQ